MTEKWKRNGGEMEEKVTMFFRVKGAGTPRRHDEKKVKVKLNKKIKIKLKSNTRREERRKKKKKKKKEEEKGRSGRRGRREKEPKEIFSFQKPILSFFLPSPTNLLLQLLRPASVSCPSWPSFASLTCASACTPLSGASGTPPTR